MNVMQHYLVEPVVAIPAAEPDPSPEDMMVSIPLARPVEPFLVSDTIYGVQIVTVCALMDYYDAMYWDWEDQNKTVGLWCDSHGAWWYSRPRESFFADEAACLAIQNGCRVVVVEDLS